LVISNYNSFPCCSTKLLPFILFEKYIYILAVEMASPWNEHCANCIGTLSCPMDIHWRRKSRQRRAAPKSPVSLRHSMWRRGYNPHLGLVLTWLLISSPFLRRSVGYLLLGKLTSKASLQDATSCCITTIYGLKYYWRCGMCSIFNYLVYSVFSHLLPVI